MAAGDIEVVINSETKAFRQGVESGIIKPLEDAEKALDDLGKSRGPAQLERELEGAQRATEDLDDEVKRTARAIEQEFRDAYRKAGDASDRFERDASGNVQGFKDEAVQNFSEVASSFNGDIQDMADGVQGLTGGLASSLTPGIGIPVAVIGAIAGAFLQSWITAAEDSEQRVEDMYGRMADAGARFLSEEKIREAIEGLDTEKVAQGLERARDLHLDQGAVLRAMVGDTQAISDIYAEMARRKQEEVDAINTAAETDALRGVSLEDHITKIEAANTEYAEQTDWLRDIQRDTDTAGKKWDAVNDALAWTAGQVSALGDSIRNLPSPTIAVRIDDSAYRNWWSRAQQRALDGITVNVRPGQGRFYE